MWVTTADGTAFLRALLSSADSLVKGQWVRLGRAHSATSMGRVSERAKDHFKESSKVQRLFPQLCFSTVFPLFGFLEIFLEQQEGNFPVIALIHLLFVKNIVFLQKADLLYSVISPPPTAPQQDHTPFSKKSVRHAWLRERIYSIIKSPRSGLSLQSNMS